MMSHPIHVTCPRDTVSIEQADGSVAQEKKTRKRRKKLFSEIREQIEFYFSDSNLRNDHFMRQLMTRSAASTQLTGNEAVPLSEIMRFNKIQSLSTSEDEVRRALTSSQLLVLSDDGSAISRKQAVDFNKDVDNCTLYVENLPEGVTHDWLKSIFSPYGAVHYVSIPKFKNKRTKGFAFIEFASESAVRSACRAFGAQVPPQNSSDSKNGQDANFKRRLVPGEDDQQETPKTNILKLDNDLNVTESSDPQVVPVSRVADHKQNVPVMLEVMKLNLRVMSKQEWSEWKKKYRQIQAENMKNVKNIIQSVDQQSVPSAIASKLANLTNPSHAAAAVLAKVTSSDVTRGAAIIKLVIQKKMGEAFEESLIKKIVRQAADPIKLAYVDVDSSSAAFQEDQSVTYTCFIRCDSHSDADSLCDRNALGSVGSASKLSGEEEERYKQRIRESREHQKQKQEKKNRKGYKKWVQRAEAIVGPAK